MHFDATDCAMCALRRGDGLSDCGRHGARALAWTQNLAMSAKSENCMLHALSCSQQHEALSPHAAPFCASAMSVETMLGLPALACNALSSYMVLNLGPSEAGLDFTF
jgi:hypothetical protein